MAMDMEQNLNFTAVVSSSNPVFSLFLLPPQIRGSSTYCSITSQRLFSFAICFFVSLVIFLVKTKFINIFTKSKNIPSLPPGPSPWPLVGNVPEMWRNRPAYRWIHRVMKELDTDIACFRLGKTNVIAVTSPEIAREFLKKNDALFASRPITINSGIFSYRFLGTAVTPWGNQWKKMRRVLVHDVFNNSKMRWMLEKRNEEADNMVRYIYNLSSNVSSSGQVVNVRTITQHYTGSVMRKMMFNKRFYGKGSEDGGPGVEEQEHISALFTVLSYLYAFSVADYLPWLRVFDLDEHEKKVKEAMVVLKKYQEVIVNERVQQWSEGKKTEAEDLLDVFITLKNENGNPALSVKEIKAQITEILLASVDNPANAAEWALSEMLNQSEQLEKAVKELDRVVGKDRLVQEDDIPNLPYVTACAREALRLHPIAPFNLPHLSMADCVVGDYFIPKGSNILLSRLGLGRNPKAKLFRQLARVDHDGDAVCKASSRVYMEHTTRYGEN
ncbi:hypothetical protein FEM48_Zijuj02G0037500 [Ziziphus jujuba var. spinosa]|uniref:Phenylalanine N-monooxygenase-like n=1 Tax=Ziziphus jujuba var. spinosa TaxID=714518 RepID=A0A978VTF6_ZIZJJ|nr:hypothetical protein FEM48_Zijuj02G0037500 [Ziziphus jujuba var. spinosa]